MLSYLSDTWAKVMSSLWTLLNLWQNWELLSFSRFTVGVQRATNRGSLAGRVEEVDEPGWGKNWKLPWTSTEQQLPFWSLKALEVCIEQTKLLSEEKQDNNNV